jgi:hypothetical protein
MNRHNLIQQLQAHQAFDEREHATGVVLLKFVQTYENCAARELQIGHLTGSAWIVDQDLTHTDMLSASWREAREESGLQNLRLLVPNIFDLDIHTIPARNKEPEHFHYDIRYAFQADRHAPLTVSSESRELAWVALDKIEALTTEESVLRMVRKTAELRTRTR